MEIDTCVNSIVDLLKIFNTKLQYYYLYPLKIYLEFPCVILTTHFFR